LLYNGPLLCSYNVGIKGIKVAVRMLLHKSRLYTKFEFASFSAVVTLRDSGAVYKCTDYYYY